MQIEILPQYRNGGTDFIPRPRRLHLGGQGAEGVDRLEFALPAEWAGLDVTLYIEHRDGTQQQPQLLAEDGTAAVDRRFTAALAGRWMLTATDGAGYTACTQPGVYDVYAALDTDEAGEEPSPTLYEQFVARVLESANTAQTAAKSALASEASAAADALAAQSAAASLESASADAQDAAARAEAAAVRAEGIAPEDGAVTSVNGKGGAVVLDAADVNALPCPASPAAGQLVRVLAVDPDTGAVTTETVAESALTNLVLHSDIPTESVSGPVRVDSSYGVGVSAAGVLQIAAATEAQLAALTDSYHPVTPAGLAAGVRSALAAGGWDADAMAAARETLGAASAAECSEAAAAMVPVGAVFWFAAASAPAGYLVCDGAAVSRTTYAALYAVTGTTFGAGNGSTTFNLPDLIDKFAEGSKTVGAARAAGLPNITGTFTEAARSASAAVATGAFTVSDVNSSTLYGDSSASSNGCYTVTFNASNSSAVYGNSSTVQPAALTLLPCIKY